MSIEELNRTALEAEETRIRMAYARRGDLTRLYSLFNPGALFMAQSRERRVLALLRKHGCNDLAGKKILEVGCGSGYWLRQFVQWGAHPENLFGVDLLPDRVQKAKRLCGPSVAILVANGVDLQFEDGTFDLVLQSTVFSSILDPMTSRLVASEMLRVLKPTGFVLWYDFFVKSPRNPDVRGVTQRDIQELFRGCSVELERVTLAPPLARRLAGRYWTLCELLELVPLLCTHHLGIIRRRGTPSAS